ncbi:hypothetical protein Leryth_003184 [Lithospermum erythrorhizon]|nr:hypothetical protein Leryth_003184 [Lithospermum erythrorhizon]
MIVEFISVLATVSSETAEKELIRLGAVNQILELFFQYPYNNFLHHHVERIIQSCLESKNTQFVEHLLQDCNLLGRILEAENNFTLATDTEKPTVPIGDKSPPRIGNIGHLTRIANKLVQFGNNNSDIQAYLQANSEWVDWQTNVLLQRNALENVFNWACGRPTALQDRMRDSDDDDYQDRDYDVAALANNLSQAFRYGIYNNDETDEAQGSLERDDEEVYFDDESAEVVISSLRLEAEQESASLVTNSDWFAFEDKRVVNEPSTASDVSPSPITEGTDGTKSAVEENVGVDEDDVEDRGTTESPELTPAIEVPVQSNLVEVSGEVTAKESPEWVEWRESSEVEPANPSSEVELPNQDIVPAASSDAQPDDVTENKPDSPSAAIGSEIDDKESAGEPSMLAENSSSSVDLQPTESEDNNHSSTEGITLISDKPQADTESSAVSAEADTESSAVAADVKE